MKYTIQMNYNASITVDVEAEEEGEALDKARDIAEDAEKAGNLVPGCEFGEVAKLELKNDEVTEDDEEA